MSPRKGNPVTMLLELIALDGTDCSAEALYSAFKNSLAGKNVSLENIVGVACDGANVMVGAKNSFTSRLVKDVPHVLILRCVCHSSALIASKACEKLPRSPEDLFKISSKLYFGKC